MLWDNRMKSQIISKSLWASILKSLIGKSKFTTVTYVQDRLILDLIVHSSFIIIVLVLLLVQVCMLVFVSIICLSWYRCVHVCGYEYNLFVLVWMCVIVLIWLLWFNFVILVLCICLGKDVHALCSQYWFVVSCVFFCADMSTVPLRGCACFYWYVRTCLCWHEYCAIMQVCVFLWYVRMCLYFIFVLNWIKYMTC